MPAQLSNPNIKPGPALPSHLAAIFMEAVARGLSAPLDIIVLLTQMALGPEPDLQKKASSSLYGQIILPLCDDFSSHGVEVANRVLVTMILTFCPTPKGRETQEILQDLQLTDQESLLSRHKKLSSPRRLSPDQRRAVKKVFILSRVTLGADIAITSPIISRVKKALPQAKIFLVGPNHLRHLFYNTGLVHLDFSYNRDGSFMEKMAAWPRLYQLIGKETRDLAPQEILLFDPDTRLSQLGLLPLTHTPSTHYFCSRKDREGQPGLAAITNNWLDHIFPDIPSSPPYFSTKPEQFATCRIFCQHFRPNTFKIVINFGVGNDDNKRLADPFEEELLASLLENRETLIILDSGKGESEAAMAKRLMAKMIERGYNTAEIAEGQLAEHTTAFEHGMLRFSGQIDCLASLIGSCNLFIGYDSCGQHVATSTETPSIICFTGAPNKRFLERWQPANHHGKTTTLVIEQRPLSSDKRAELIGKIIHRADQYRP